MSNVTVHQHETKRAAIRAPFLVVGLKAYLGQAESEHWLAGVAERSRSWPAGAITVLPSYTALPVAARVLAGTGVRWGAQDVFWESGAHTGEVPAAVLAELGCTCVEIGHSERRAQWGETDAIVARKAAAAVAAGIVPIIFVGEQRRAEQAEAASMVHDQAAAILRDIPSSAEIVLAYEPVWQSRAAEHAAPDHVAAVCSRLEELRRRREGTTYLMYGGAVKPGTFSELRAQTPLDGVGIARMGLDVDRLAEIAEEVLGGAGRRGQTVRL